MVVSSLVVLSILDHHMRRPEHDHRVIGCLFGRHEDGKLQVSNCSPIPHVEDEEGVSTATQFTMCFSAIWTLNISKTFVN